MSWVSNAIRLRAKQFYRLPMSLLLRNLVRWKPQIEPVPGYTVVIACMEALAPVAVANLRLCARQSGTQLHEILLVFDCRREQIPPEVEEAVREVTQAVRVRLIGYDRYQHRIAKAIHWGWVYAWLSWCLGIAESQTKAVLIHDLDALPVGLGLFDRLHDQWAKHGAEFCGIRCYSGNGITPEMRLVTTFELTLDASFLRRTFRPFDLFNKLMIVDSRVVDFDTMLYTQWCTPHRVVCPIEEDQLVHPSQLICNYTDLMAGRTNFLGRSHMLPVLAYYMFIGGDPKPVTMATTGLVIVNNRTVNLFGHDVYVDGILPPLWAWMEKQVRRVELAIYGATRPEIESYLRGFILRAGTTRTVGQESGAMAVPDR